MLIYILIYILLLIVIAACAYHGFKKNNNNTLIFYFVLSIISGIVLSIGLDTASRSSANAYFVVSSLIFAIPFDSFMGLIICTIPGYAIGIIILILIEKKKL